MDKKREEKKIIADEKTQKLQQEWKEREKNIPTYISPFLDKAFDGITNDIKEEKAKNEHRNFLLFSKGWNELHYEYLSTICDYISQMTDNYAIKEYHELYLD